MNVPYQAVLLIAFGGPTCPEEIRPFLARVTKGIPIPPERLEEVVHHYEAIGGKSPLNEITFRQAEALKRVLQGKRLPLPVYVGMRNARPFFVETLRQMANDGIRRALGCILSSHRTEASWDRYQKTSPMRGGIGSCSAASRLRPGWHDHPFSSMPGQNSFSELRRPPGPPAPDHRAHFNRAQPARGNGVSFPYGTAANYGSSDRRKLDHERWSIAYQSRSGKPTDPWLEPDIGAAIRRLAAEGCKDVVLAPIGFVCDHVEVLYDLDIEAKKIAEDHGVRFLRASCPNDHPTFIHMMANVIERKLKTAEDRG
jgi:ferrochelatase